LEDRSRGDALLQEPYIFRMKPTIRWNEKPNASPDSMDGLPKSGNAFDTIENESGPWSKVMHASTGRVHWTCGGDTGQAGALQMAIVVVLGAVTAGVLVGGSCDT
jgi:hypothetical protein